MPIQSTSRRKFLKEATRSIAAGALVPAFTVEAGVVDDSEQVTFYPTYGFRRDDDWIIPLRAWVHEPRDGLAGLLTRVVTKAATSLGETTTEETTILRSRVADFLADSESRERIEIEFERDPERERFLIEDEAGTPLKTDGSGRVEGIIRLSREKAKILAGRQEAAGGWLSFKAVSDEHTGLGRAQLIDRIGRSVISDVDDTIKVTEIPAGARIVVRNTFFREFVVAPGMQERYAGFGNVPFHYVSGGPWQLFDPLVGFLFPSFPHGSFHMKTIPTNLLNLESWEELIDVAGPDATENHKLREIRALFSHFPARSFILVGDSGEHDPAIYRRLQSEFPRQIDEIVMRDVIDLRHTNPEQLEGMTVIPAPTVVKGKSNLGV